MLPNQLWQHHVKLQQELQELLDHSQNEQALIEQERATHQHCVQLAEQISVKRKQAGEKLAEQVTQQIKQLSMENGEFFVDVKFDLKNYLHKGLILSNLTYAVILDS